MNALKRGIKQKQDQIEFENPYGDGKSAIRIVNSLKVISLDQNLAKDHILMQKVFITGGSGTVGSAFITEFHKKYKFSSYSRNEKMQVALKRNFPDVEIILGAVEDKISIMNSIHKHKPDIVIHAAAMKHVIHGEIPNRSNKIQRYWQYQCD